MNEKIEKIITNSGNNFHYNVVNYLRSNNWHVVVSPYYNDHFTDKPREVDIIAEKEYDYLDFGEWIGTTNIRLFIECKYVKNNNVFWFDDKEYIKALERVILDTPLEDPYLWSITKKHHYLREEKVAKLFDTESNKQIENESIYKAMTQSINALTYYRKETSIIPKVKDKAYNILSLVNYPVIICNSFDNFYKYDPIEKRDPVVINHNFQLEVNYAYIDKEKKYKNEYFLIDIVDFNKVNDFIKDLEGNDLKAIREKIGYDRD